MQTFQLRDSRLCKGNVRQQAVERLPGIPSPLAASMQPLEAGFYGRLVEPPQRLRISSHTIILVMPLQRRIEFPEEPMLLLMPIEPYPFLDAFQD